MRRFGTKVVGSGMKGKVGKGVQKQVGQQQTSVKKVSKKVPKSQKGENKGVKDDAEYFLRLIRARPDERGVAVSQGFDVQAAGEVAKEYTRQRMIEHNNEFHVRALRRVLMRSAISNLPTPELREQAKIVDDTPFPAYRRVPTWTPPIKNYKP